MKEISVEELTQNLIGLLDIAQRERVIVTRMGKPSAVILGLEFKDEEDYALERDVGFWEMIRQAQRKDDTVS